MSLAIFLYLHSLLKIHNLKISWNSKCCCFKYVSWLHKNQCNSHLNLVHYILWLKCLKFYQLQFHEGVWQQVFLHYHFHHLKLKIGDVKTPTKLLLWTTEQSANKIYHFQINLSNNILFQIHNIYQNQLN